MAVIAPPPAPPHVGAADDDRMRRFRRRLSLVMSASITVVATGWFCTLGVLPAIIADAGDRASKRFIEFFTATTRNGNTRRAYARRGKGGHSAFNRNALCPSLPRYVPLYPPGTGRRDGDASWGLYRL